MTAGRLPLSPVLEHGCGVVGADHPMLAGHFPGHPIVPGAWLLAWIVAAANRRLAAEDDPGRIAGARRVKFLRPLMPDQPFECSLDLRARAHTAGAERNDTVRFTLTSGGTTIATGSLQLQPFQPA